MAKRSPTIFSPPESQIKFMAAYNTDLNHWPVDYRPANIASDFGSTFVLISGPKEAPPLILLHAARANSLQWQPNVSDLSQHFRVYALDILGDAGKSDPGLGLQSRADCEAWLAQVMKNLKVQRAHVLGLSQGAWLAITLALAAPERVERLVLVSPAASLAPFTNKEYGLRLASLLPWAPFQQNALRLLYGDRHQLDDATIAQFKLTSRHFRPLRSGWLTAVRPKTYSDAELKRLQAPTLVVVGEKDILFDTGKALERAKKLIPQVETEIIPEAGHFPCTEQPDRFNARVLTFLGID